MNLSVLPWFHVLKKLENPKLRLFCFSYAGGSASIFYEWQERLPEGVEVFSVQLPGRSDRMAEKPMKNLSEIVDSLYREIQPYIQDYDYCFFGHSMGARLSYELASLLELKGCPAPRALLVSGALAPDLARKKKNIHHLSDHSFVQELGQLNGTPSEVLENKPLMELVLPTLKADFQVCETWPLLSPKKINVPIVAFCGDSDDDILPEDMKCWERFSGEGFRFYLISGDHFFIHSQERELLSLIGNYFEQAVLIEEVHS